MRPTILGMFESHSRTQVADSAGAPSATNDSVLRNSLRRITHWATPPNWSPADWEEEMQAQGAAAMLRAVGDYDPGRNVPLDAFGYQRVVAEALTRYRQEWRYAMRCGASLDDEQDRSPDEADGAESIDADAVRVAMRQLPAGDQALLQRLYWDQRAEADVAGELGISQQAVNKRKRAIIQQLRELIDTTVPA